VAGNPEVHILTAREVSVPIVTRGPQEVSPRLLKLRSDFLAGKELSSDELGELINTAAEPSNGNCNIC
jgi:hypothetical protein